MKIDTKHMVDVTVTAESEEDNHVVGGIHRWIRANEIRTRGSSDKRGTLNEYRVLLSAEDADRLLAHLGRP